MKTQQYVALLRGINVGGNKPIKMDAIRKAFASFGFEDVKTLLASGNVVFRAPQSSETALAQQIKAALKEHCGVDIGIILRSVEELEKITRANPFQKISVTPETRLYATFYPAKLTKRLKVPFQSASKTFRIIQVSAREIFTVLTLSEKTQSSDLMSFLSKEFGDGGTTRNWNTVIKIVDAVQELDSL